jgi:hypothetical protein
MKVLGVIDHQPSIEGESDNQSGADSEVKTGTVGDPSAATAPNTAPSAGAKSSKSKASASQ